DSRIGSDSVIAVMSAARPLFHRKRKSICDLAMSPKCQEATYAVQRTRLLFDHVVCALLEKPSLPCSLDARNEVRVPATSHGRTPSDRSVGAQFMNSTLVPLWTIFASACASQLVR